MKKYLLTVCFILFSFSVYSAEPSYQLSTHILDISKGEPASNVEIILYKLDKDGKTWVQVDKGITNKNGRITNFLPDVKNNNGIYKLQFLVSPYFKSQDIKSIYPYVDVVFEVKGKGHYHIPITMSANGYATYRGN